MTKPAHLQRIITRSVDFHGVPRKFRQYSGWADEAVLKTIPTNFSYPLINLRKPVEHVMDIGANCGAASIWFATYYTDAIVHAYEPSPHAYQLLIENTRHIENIQCHNVGLLNETKEAQMHHGAHGSVMDSLYDVDGTKDRSDAFTVQLQDVSEIDIRPDILKVDAEGAEYPILKAMSDRGMLNGVSVIYFEYHFEEDRRRIDDLLHETHYITTAQIYFPTQGEIMYVNREVPFPEGMTFIGEDAPRLKFPVTA